MTTAAPIFDELIAEFEHEQRASLPRRRSKKQTEQDRSVFERTIVWLKSEHMAPVAPKPPENFELDNLVRVAQKREKIEAAKKAASKTAELTDKAVPGLTDKELVKQLAARDNRTPEQLLLAVDAKIVNIDTAGKAIKPRPKAKPRKTVKAEADAIVDKAFGS